MNDNKYIGTPSKGTRWGTFCASTHPKTKGFFTYNPSDYRAWLSGRGLASYVNSLPSDEYLINLTAHSMGNIVSGSALRHNMLVENYALLNAAVPAMCYDTDKSLLNLELGKNTPDDDSGKLTKYLGFSAKFSENNGAKLINFYLEGDSALTGLIDIPLSGKLGGWLDNNKNYKPQPFPAEEAGYYYYPSRDDGKRLTVRFLTKFDRDIWLLEEALAYVTQSKSATVGATSGVNGSIRDEIDMDKYGFGDTHSAQWKWRFQKTHEFYYDLMEQLELQPIK